MTPVIRHGLYNISSRREKWKRIMKRGEGAVLVKGTNRRVIVVRSPDPKLFEEAIFVLREDGGAPKDAELVMAQASRAAGEYLKKCGVPAPRRRRGLAPVLIAAACLLAVGIAAAAVYLFIL